MDLARRELVLQARHRAGEAAQRRGERAGGEAHVEEVEAAGVRDGGFQRLPELGPRAHEMPRAAQRVAHAREVPGAQRAVRGLGPEGGDHPPAAVDGSILSCIDLKDGARKWKGGRYGHGQLVLLPEQDLLLVLSEQGELALVSALPGQYTEIARVPAIEGKSWSHPVLVGDVVLVRNAQEMAAFQLRSEPKTATAR